jgi:hypothetical protein
LAGAVQSLVIYAQFNNDQAFNSIGYGWRLSVCPINCFTGNAKPLLGRSFQRLINIGDVQAKQRLGVPLLNSIFQNKITKFG